MNVSEAILGCLLLKSELIYELPRNRNLFQKKEHNLLFNKILEYKTNNKDFDILLIKNELKNEHNIDVSFIDDILSKEFFISNFNIYYDILKKEVEENILYTNLIKCMQELRETHNPEQVKNMMLDFVKDNFTSDESNDIDFKQEIKNILNDIEKRNNNNGYDIKTGYDSIDKYLCYFEENSLNIIAARPSVGKTTFALNLAWNICKKQGLSVGFISLEMSRKEIITKLICIDKELKYKHRYYPDELKKFVDFALEYDKDKKFILNDNSKMSVYDIVLWAKKQKIKNNIKALFIDYLSLIDTTIFDKNLSFNYKVGIICKVLKQFAKEEKIPVFLIAQLNRNNESRSNKRPVKSDLRDSGEIEQDADKIIFLHREDYYKNKENSENTVINKVEVEVIIDKNRNGNTFMQKLFFYMPFCKFVDKKDNENIEKLDDLLKKY